MKHLETGRVPTPLQEARRRVAIGHPDLNVEKIAETAATPSIHCALTGGHFHEFCFDIDLT